MMTTTPHALRCQMVIAALILLPSLLSAADRARPAAVERISKTMVPNVDGNKKQGYQMRLKLDNRGVFGKMAYPGNGPNVNDSLGLEYPVGQRIEHIFGGGIWIGGIVDTLQDSLVSGPRFRVVTTSYEGWAGPLYECFPGSNPADTIWINSRTQPKPAGWDEYWGPTFPYRPISDQDMHCIFYDDSEKVDNHVPMHLKVIQSSYAWNDPYAEAIILLEYRIMNNGIKQIDSAYLGFFFEADLGPYDIANYYLHDFSGYYPNSRTGYVHNPTDRGSTPAGATLLYTPKPLDSLRYSFNWFPGPETPAPDLPKYQMMSSGFIKPDEYPRLSDTRFLFAFGPFDIKGGGRDTLKIAVAIVSGYSKTRDPRLIMQRNAARALDIYLNQGIKLPATPPSPPLRVNVGFRRVELDWKWRTGDDQTGGDPRIYGRWNPEANWDTTNQLARRDPARWQPGYMEGMQTGIDTTKGGRNFEAYRLWRSENPDYPDESFTLIRQFDVIETIDSLRYQYDSGLEYNYIDSNLVRGKTYVYAVTSVSIPNLAAVKQPDGSTTYEEVEPLESGFRVNATVVDLPFAVSQEAGKVAVVPNPYRTDQNYTLESGGYEGPSAGWDEGRRRVKFINLPEHCTIRIFSLAGDLVRTIQHDGGGGQFPRGDVDVLLVSDSNRALASGIYIFTVESEFGAQTGKFVIIR